MIVCKRRHDDKALSTIATTLGSVYRPDPAIPESMLALLRTLDVTAAYVVATAASRKPPLTV